MLALMKMSDYIIPSVCVFIIIYGLFKEINVFEAFIEGATEGINVAIKILPTLIALLLAVGMLRSSGVLNGIVKIISPLIANFTDFPAEVVPVALMRTISASASTGLILDIFKTYGPDSFLGRLVSIMFGCSETIFYTMSVYFMTINIKDTRYTLSGALIATLAGIIASYLLCMYLFVT